MSDTRVKVITRAPTPKEFVETYNSLIAENLRLHRRIEGLEHRLKIEGELYATLRESYEFCLRTVQLVFRQTGWLPSAFIIHKLPGISGPV